jgi:hypothetical protein
MIMTRPTVAVVRTSPETVLDDYARLIELAAFRPHLDSATTTMLVSSASRRFWFPGVNAPPWQIEGVTRALRAAGYLKLAYVPAAANGPLPDTSDFGGYNAILQTYRVPQQGVRRLLYDDTIHMPSYALRQNLVYLTPFRPSMIASVHALDSRWYTRNWTDATLVDLLARQNAISAGAAVVIDGTTIAHGANQRPPEIANMLLASTNQVAADAVAAWLVGLEPRRDLAYMRLAHERGLGIADLSRITIVGDTEILDRRLAGETVVPDHWLDAFLKPFSVLTYYRWSDTDRAVFESWLRDTGWGRLFQQYQRRALHKLV